MNSTFKKRQRTFFLILIVISLALYGLHSLLTANIPGQDSFFYPLWSIYLFHFITVFFVYAMINFKNAQGKKRIFYTFMALTFGKMALAIVFLLPLLFSQIENKQADVFNFFIPYFLFLGIEVYTISSFLRKT